MSAKELLEQVIKATGKTRAQIAHEIHYSPTTLKNIEHGYNKGGAKLISALEGLLPLSSTPQDETQVEGAESLTAMHMDDAPSSAIEESTIEKLLKKIGVEKAQPTSTPTGKLTKKQQATFDMFFPLTTRLTIFSCVLIWGVIDKPYADVLKPTDKQAEQIIAPLLRVTVRSLKYVGGATPNQLDIAAALFAVANYVVASFQVYRQIKRIEEETGATAYVRQRDGTYDQSKRRREDDNSSAISGNASDGSSVRDVGNGDVPDEDGHSRLTEREKYQFDALSRLRERDKQVRARRNGAYGIIH